MYKKVTQKRHNGLVNARKPYKKTQLWALKCADRKYQHMIGYSPSRENQWKGSTVDPNRRKLA